MDINQPIAIMKCLLIYNQNRDKVESFQLFETQGKLTVLRGTNLLILNNYRVSSTLIHSFPRYMSPKPIVDIFKQINNVHFFVCQYLRDKRRDF